jgi:ankyrin repeat protein
MLLREEVSSPKTINIKQYLSRRNFLVDNRYFVIKSSQTTQLYKAAWQGHKEVVQLLISAGASLSVENKKVIKTSVKLRQSNVKPFK